MWHRYACVVLSGVHDQRLVQHKSGLSVTSFHRHFRAITTLTPIQYQKQLRLQVARSMLMGASKNVTAVGYAVGYDSPSQFSREYKRLFGYPPGEDGKRLAKILSTVSHFEQD
ncbi:AraC family transcriptional regulator [Natronospirillum operosum]|uniref:AraC family transcriptional regulator n=1 Tax=Natronospirillum operosum TaxID=2759953 RepID=A0A4Z0WB72_9GAMM|nr:AraC family transcriptional regulator [Natronospirillum operosum]TGG91710.1 AraC family transcriptional regulator [Natronospirillum operosum]